MKSDNEIREFVLRNVREHPGTIVRVAADRFGYSRQGVYRHVRELVDSGLLLAEGQTKARTYSLAVLKEMSIELDLAGLEEDVIWREKIAPLLSDVPENIRRISQYGFTEILNNAIVHSSGTKVEVAVEITAANLDYKIHDNGIGIFKKLREDLHLEDERHAILELSKGKLTTNPARHTGEGIFFTTRSFDDVAFRAGELVFLHTRSGDWLVDERPLHSGTFVHMDLDRFANRSLKEVFDKYTSGDDDYGFTKTQIPIFLAKYGDENLVSRSQAKRVVARLDRFQEVLLDFQGVASIGQAFADEIFRVFKTDHPDVHLVSVGANEEVSQMIRRALPPRKTID